LSDAAAKPEVPRRLTIATRESALAMWQAEHIRAQLAARYPASEVILLGMTTEGDRVQDRSLADVGGKGLFIKELEVAMADGRADLAVHSLKDIPMDMPEGFVLAAITARDDPRDAFVSNHYLDIAALPGGARIGTSSLRREAQLRERDPLLSILPLRGQRQHAAAQARRGWLRRDHPRRGGVEAPRPRAPDQRVSRSG
jgi:hydroxymethylbilane synthase